MASRSSRAAELCYPILDLVPAAKKRTTNVAKLRVLARENMLEALSRVAEFRRYDARRKDCVTTDPPGPVVALLLPMVAVAEVL